LSAQRRKIKKADTLFVYGEYFRAKDKYKKALTKIRDKKLKGEICFKLAECYRFLNIQRKQASYYKKAIRLKYSNPVAVLYLANALKMREKHDDALEFYNQYIELVPDDPRGQAGVESIELIKEWIDNPTRYEIENVKDINSKFSDFCPSYARKDFREVYFTSSREGSKGTKFNNHSGQNFTDIFQTFLDKKGKWSEPNVLPGNKINSEFDEGASAFNQKASTIFFTSCRKEKGKNLGCKIYTSTKSDKEWNSSKILEIVNDSTISVGHPSISADELTLYFVMLDYEGGYGGRDIWKTTRASKSKSWGTPVNLGAKINTPDDDMYPYIKSDGTLYFSSNGHIGMGGHDLFEATLNDEDKWEVKNMQYPMNSFGDDFGIVFQGDENIGLFTSNREGGKGSEDIYSFVLPKINLSLHGTVRDEETGDIIAGAGVSIVGSEGTTLEKNSAKDGTFRFELNADADYIVRTSKDKYFRGKGKETTKGIREDKILTMDVYMKPIDIGIPIEIENIEYDYNSTVLRPESMVALDNLVEILEDNQNISIELGSHTDFRGGDDFNDSLSLGRAQSVVDYLILKNIEADRVIAKGYGETMPIVIDKKRAANYSYFNEGDTLTEEFINHLASDIQKEVAHQINRRTEFKVLSMNYVPKVRKEIKEEKKPVEELEKEDEEDAVIEEEKEDVEELIEEEPEKEEEKKEENEIKTDSEKSIKEK
jgi:peptidoglycan-associated lipoprotein